MKSNLVGSDVNPEYGWDYYSKTVMPCGGVMVHRILFCHDDATAQRVVRKQQKSNLLYKVTFYREPATHP